MAAMVARFIFAMVVVVGCGKNGNVLVLKKVIGRTADEIYKVNPGFAIWFY